MSRAKSAIASPPLPIERSGVQAVWMNGRVPNGFWDLRPNRVAFMNWLGRRLRFKTPDDWYALTPAQIGRHRGNSVFSAHYGNSLIRVLRERYPDYPWNHTRLNGRLTA